MDRTLAVTLRLSGFSNSAEVGHVARVSRSEILKMTKLECEVVKSCVQVYCSPNLAEHAAIHARRNVVQTTALSKHPEPESLAVAPTSWWPFTTRFGAEPDLDAFDSFQFKIAPPKRCVMISFQASDIQRSELCRPPYSIDQATPSTALGIWPSAPIRKLGHLRIFSSGNCLPLRLMLS
jgi:hypothetical protein